MKPTPRWLLLTAIVLVVAPANAQDVTPLANDATTAVQAVATLPPLQPADTSSVRATLKSFIDACNELDALAETDQDGDNFRDRILPAAERIKDCLDLNELPVELRDTVGVESGVYLKEVLDRIELPEEVDIPETEAGENSTSAPWRIPGTRIAIARVTEGPDQGAYLFTTDTVRRAAKLYSVAAQLPYRTEGPIVSPGFHERYLALTKRQPVLTADTASPRGTFMLFLSKTNETYEIMTSSRFVDRSDPANRPLVMQILRCMDLSELPEYSREHYATEAAVCLKETLDRIPLPPPEQIPGPEDVKPISGGEPLASWQIPNTKLIIARIQDGPQRGEYLFSAKTVQSAVELYDEIKNQPYRTDGQPVSAGLHDWFLSSPADPLVAAWIQRLPDVFSRRYFSLALWQWIGLVIGTCLAIGLMVLAYRVGEIRSERTREISLFRYWASLLFAIIAMLVPLAFKEFAWQYLTLRGTSLYIVEFIANLAFLGALIVVLLGTGSRLADSIAALPKAKSHQIDPTLIRILFRLLSIVAATIVFLEGGRYLGFPITTLLASAGIGGLAIAFAAQGMIRGLFGTVTILLDRPFRVGDRIIVKDQDGVVEEIGLRSTKIREFQTGHLISMPNDQMADAEIKNIGQRPHIRRMSDLHIPIDTSREKLEKAITTIRQVLDNHEGMDPENPPRVYFTDFNPDSFNIRVIYWYSPPNLWKFYEMSERVNLEIFRIFDEHGIQFSLPLRHSFWKHDDQQGPLDVTILDDRGENDSPQRDPA